MYGAQDFAHDTGVTPETLALYVQWHALLLKWNRSINLVQARALEQFWQRHALDSHQIVSHAPSGCKTVLDMGSGAGFPGLSMAIALRSQKDAQVILVDSAGKKASFLRTAIRELALPGRASSERVEALSLTPVDVITARAFAPLPKLLAYALPYWHEDTQAILLKGQRAQDEIEQAKALFDFDVTLSPSLTDPEGRIVVIKGLRSKGTAEQDTST